MPKPKASAPEFPSEKFQPGTMWICTLEADQHELEGLQGKRVHWYLKSEDKGWTLLRRQGGMSFHRVQGLPYDQDIENFLAEIKRHFGAQLKVNIDDPNLWQPYGKRERLKGIFEKR